MGSCERIQSKDMNPDTAIKLMTREAVVEPILRHKATDTLQAAPELCVRASTVSPGSGHEATIWQPLQPSSAAAAECFGKEATAGVCRPVTECPC